MFGRKPKVSQPEEVKKGGTSRNPVDKARDAVRKHDQAGADTKWAQLKFDAFTADTRDGVVLTARSLFLNQEVSCFLRKTNVKHIPFNEGSLTQTLGLTPTMVESGFTGKDVLDVAGGASILPEELMKACGARSVTVIDLNAKQYKNRLDSNSTRSKVAKIYKDNMIKMEEAHEWYCKVNKKDRQYWKAALRMVIRQADPIAQKYFQETRHIKRKEGNATDMKDLPSDEFDIVLNSWMLMYMDRDTRRKAIKEMVRVTRPGGQIRIQGGSEKAEGATKTRNDNVNNEKQYALSVPLFVDWFKNYKVKGVKAFNFSSKKKVIIDDEESRGSLVVLKVVKRK